MRTPISTLPGRYKPVVVNGQTQHMRDKVALKAEAIELVRSNGPLTKTQIMIELRTVSRFVDGVLAEAERAGEIESFVALSKRRRMDEFWCAAGEAPRKSAVRYNAAAVLAAMQRHAHHLANGGRA
ncbi:hypothetical protein [Paraburkholderia sp. J41]|uniref:hypothetical protein n=1 Tax=Paraburkholderia sp. J41 TaxID=2805433 RepID=UPI002AC31B88|nr:hypothetical protein [Paraburkholderia sp. J41]